MAPCIHFPGINAIASVGGPVIRMDTGKGLIAFEWHSYCGPMPISLARGRVGKERVLPAKHPFWAKVTRWVEQGRVVENGWAVVRARVDCDACNGGGRGEHLGGRNYRTCTKCNGTGEAR